MTGWLIFMGWRYASYATRAVVGYEACQADPTSCVDRDLHMSIWTVIEVDPDGYVIRKVSAPVPVAVPEGGSTEGLAVGDRVSLVGRYDTSRQVIVEHTRLLHRWRRVKEVFSILGLLGIMGMIPFVYTWRDGAVVLRG